MKLPICRIDAQTNTLCRKCKALYREGKISDVEIELSKVLVELAKSNKDLNAIHFYSAIELDNIIILVVRKNDLSILLEENVLSELESNVHKKIRFLEKTNNPKKLVESLIDPIPVLNVTVLYIPPFSDKEYKIELEQKYKEKLPISENILIQTVSSVLGTGVYLEYV
ncbi:MAG: hypothetical protein ACTSQE_02675 [Candidatus Heimdallarchaeaceae archaeon]